MIAQFGYRDRYRDARGAPNRRTPTSGDRHDEEGVLVILLPEIRQQDGGLAVELYMSTGTKLKKPESGVGVGAGEGREGPSPLNPVETADRP